MANSSASSHCCTSPALLLPAKRCSTNAGKSPRTLGTTSRSKPRGPPSASCASGVGGGSPSPRPGPWCGSCGGCAGCSLS
eukprot:10856011-Lingulodinium_polyedra.AAC.1